jgi:hypothetical protein
MIIKAYRSRKSNAIKLVRWDGKELIIGAIIHNPRSTEDGAAVALRINPEDWLPMDGKIKGKSILAGYENTPITAEQRLAVVNLKRKKLDQIVALLQKYLKNPPGQLLQSDISEIQKAMDCIHSNLPREELLRRFRTIFKIAWSKVWSRIKARHDEEKQILRIWRRLALITSPLAANHVLRTGEGCLKPPPRSELKPDLS